MTVIGIFGGSFCGSTTISNVLDGLPDVFACGESIGAYTGIREGHLCGSCHAIGADCPIWTPSFSEGCLGKASDWWDRIHDQSGASLIVSSDKMPHYYNTLGWPDKAILLWKDLKAWVHSMWRRDKDYNESGMSIANIDAVIDTFIRHYRFSLDELKALNIPYMPLQLEDFIQDQQGKLKEICEFIGAEYNAVALDIWATPHHQVAGNAEAKGINRCDSHMQMFGKCAELRIDGRWRGYLTRDQSDYIDNHAQYRALIKEIKYGA